MLPIAVLPVAALLLRLGQQDLLDIPAIAAAGNAIFSNLGLLFAIGVAVGLARENHGAAGLASVVGYLVTTKGAEVLIAVPPEVTAQLAGQARDFAIAAFRERELAKLSVPAGLLNGLIAGYLYNRYSDIRLPAYLAFFGGRRFVPIASGTAGIVLALAFGFGWPILERGMDATSDAVLASDSIGLFAYGVLNRVLIVTGLHHILNNVAWFLLGDLPRRDRRPQTFLRGRPDRGRVHVRPLRRDDVWSAGGVPGHVSSRASAPARRCGRHVVLDGADFVSHRRDRAHRVFLHVPGASVVWHSRGADRHRDGGHGPAERAARVSDSPRACSTTC